MSKFLYCVFDKVSKEVSAPMVLNNDDVARRFFQSEVVQKSPYPTDYALLCLGAFDCATGEIYNGGYPCTVDTSVKEDDLFNKEGE